MEESLLRQTIPVVVNSYNQPTYLLRTVATLIAHDFRNIWVIDQASTTRETKQALSLLGTSARCKVFNLRSNFGPHWFLSSELCQLAGNLFAYTDADLDFPTGLPDSFLSRLLMLTQKYQVGKAGCALDISDSDLFADRLTVVGGKEFTIRQWEERFWLSELEPEVYAAIIDTTFAVYNRSFFRKESPLRAVRVAGPWTAKHLPWYDDKRISADEWRAYESSTRHSHWFNSSRPNTNESPLKNNTRKERQSD